MKLTQRSKSLFSVWCIGFLTLGLAQKPHVAQDHKPLLGEIHYGNRIGGLTAQEGETVEMICINEGDILTGIQVYVKDGGLIEGFELQLIKGEVTQRFTFGTTHGIPQKEFKVIPGLKLVGISGACGWYLDNLQFHFNDGSTTPRYGGSGGDIDFRLVLNQNRDGAYRGRLTGFWGSYTNQLETLGLIFWPLE